MSENYLKTITDTKVYPIIRSKNPEEALMIAKALIAGGIRILEINVETPEIYEVINKVSKETNISPKTF